MSHFDDMPYQFTPEQLLVIRELSTTKEASHMAKSAKSYRLNQKVRTTLAKYTTKGSLVPKGTLGVIVSTRLVDESHCYVVAVPKRYRELLFTEEEIEAVKIESVENVDSIDRQLAHLAGSEIYLADNAPVTYCPECDRYFDIRVGCPCDVAFELRSTLESKGIDCNTALLAQETLLSISVPRSNFQTHLIEMGQDGKYQEEILTLLTKEMEEDGHE